MIKSPWIVSTFTRFTLVLLLFAACTRNQGRNPKTPIDSTTAVAPTPSGSAELAPIQKVEADSPPPPKVDFPAELNLRGAVRAIYRRSDGRIWIGGDFDRFVLLLAPNGKSVDADSAQPRVPSVNGPVLSWVEVSDGAVVMGGDFTDIDGAVAGRIAKVHADGSVDREFLQNAGQGFNAPVTQLRVTSQGRILAAGSFTSFNGQSVSYVARLLMDGSWDSSFSTGTEAPVPSSLPSESSGDDVAPAPPSSPAPSSSPSGFHVPEGESVDSDVKGDGPDRHDGHGKRGRGERRDKGDKRDKGEKRYRHDRPDSDRGKKNDHSAIEGNRRTVRAG